MEGEISRSFRCKKAPLCFYHVYQEFEQRKEGVRKRHINATLLASGFFLYSMCQATILVHLFAYTHSKVKGDQRPKSLL